MKFELTNEEPELFEPGQIRLTITTDLDTALQIIKDYA